MKRKWLILAPFFSSWYLISVSLNTCIKSSKAITNSNGENKPPKFSSPNLNWTNSFPSACHLVFYVFMLCLTIPMILLANPTIPIVDKIHEWGDHIISYFIIHLSHVQICLFLLQFHNMHLCIASWSFAHLHFLLLPPLLWQKPILFQMIICFITHYSCK